MELPDGSTRYIILINGSVYKNVVKIGGNENYTWLSKSKGKVTYIVLKRVITR